VTKIDDRITRAELAAIIVSKLMEHGINAVLVGGAVVSIYTQNKYESDDLDFIAPASDDRITKAMAELGFTRKGKDFEHPKTRFTVEFPGRRVAIGDDDPVVPEGRLRVGDVDIVLLSPTQSVMDRLCWFFLDNDRQCLDQAVWIAQKQPIDFDAVKAWANREGHDEKYGVFLKRLGR
jgi:hypothetical protein